MRRSENAYVSLHLCTDVREVESTRGGGGDVKGLTWAAMKCRVVLNGM